MRSTCLFLLLAFVLATSCKKTSTRFSRDYGIDINMEETLDSTTAGRRLILHCSTKQYFGCSNYKLLHSVSSKGNHITITFGDINDPGMCLTSTGPARANIDLGVLNSGTYTITLADSSFCDVTLRVSPTSYTVTSASSAGIDFSSDHLRRFPANTIWGTVGYVNVSQDAVVNSFFDSLAFYGVQPYDGPTGNYYYFTLNSNNTWIDSNNGYWESRNFIYRYSGKLETLKTLMRNYNQRDKKDSLFIHFRTDKGQLVTDWNL